MSGAFHTDVDTASGYDYMNGQLDALITVCIEEKAKVFVSAIGIPPKHVIDRLHANGILYMNMIGHPKHVAKCVEAGVDILGAQGSEGGGHTGNIPTGILVTSVAKLVRGVKSKFTDVDVQVVAAGGDCSWGESGGGDYDGCIWGLDGHQVPFS